MNITGIMNGLGKLVRSGRQFAVKHAPEILMGMGTTGLISSLWLAVKAGPKAVILTEQAEMDKAKQIYGDEPVKIFADNIPYETNGRVLMEPLTWQEKAKTLAPLYIPPVGLALFSLICFWAAHGIDLKRQAVVMGLYSTAEATLNEYQRKVADMLGEKQVGEIRQSIAEDHAAMDVKKLPPPEDYDLGTQKWCYIRGRRFPSSYNKIKDVQNQFNHQLLNDMYGSEADLFWMLDPSGEWLRPDNQSQMSGWTVDRFLVLRIANPSSPVLEITYEDKYGLDYLPMPGFTNGY